MKRWIQKSGIVLVLSLLFSIFLTSAVFAETSQFSTPFGRGNHRFYDNGDKLILTGGFFLKGDATNDIYSVETNKEGATLTFSFTGKTAKIYGIRNDWSGVMDISLDGGTAVEVDLYVPRSESAADTLMYAIETGISATHTVTVTVKQNKDGRDEGAGYVCFKRIEVDYSIALEKGMYFPADFLNAADEQPITFSGTWNKNGENDVESCTVGSSLKISFYGESITLYGHRHDWSGHMKVQLDNEASVDVDLYRSTKPDSPKAMFAPIYFSGELSSGYHTLTVTVADKIEDENARVANYIPLSMICIGSTEVLSQGEYDFAQSVTNGIVLTTAESGETWDGSVVGDGFEFHFSGSAAEIRGHRDATTGKIAVSIDGSDPVTVDLSQSSSEDNALYYLTPTLGNGNHIVHISVPGDRSGQNTNKTIQPQKINVLGVSTTLTVKYLDESGTEIAETNTYHGIAGKSTYELEPIYSTDYAFVRVSGSENGIFPDTDSTITYIYRSTPDRVAATYYLDADSGNDTNDGKSSDTAWKTLDYVNHFCFMPGDKLLIRSGTTYRGMLYPHGSGAEDAPFVIDIYGGEIKPIIDGEGEVPVAVYFLNSEHIEINNLEVTNWNETTGLYAGIMVDVWNTGRTMEHVYIRNCLVRDINGKRDWCTCDWMKKTGGIIVTSSSTKNLYARGEGFVADATKPTNIRDIRIENNRTERVGSVGIQIGNSEVNRWCHRNTKDDAEWRPFEDIVIRNNYIYGGLPREDRTKWSDMACLMFSCENVICEKNFVTDWITSGIETWSSDNVVFQYNEVQRINNRGDGSGDSCAFDSDGHTSNVTIQYNYAHDNGCGILLYGYGFGYDVVARYNLLIDNGRSFTGMMEGEGGGAYVYNNTVIKTENHISYGNDHFVNASGCHFENNIFYATEGCRGLDFVAYGGTTSAATATYHHNVYAGMLTIPSVDVDAITTAPEFVSLVTSDLETIAGETSKTTNEIISRFYLTSDSILYEMGLAIENNGGYDLLGTAIPETGISMGALQKTNS